jgi:hypothetical protein
MTKAAICYLPSFAWPFTNNYRLFTSMSHVEGDQAARMRRLVDAETGHAVDQVQDLTMLLVPGRATSAVHNAMVVYCEVDRDGTVFATLDPPANGGSQP